MNTLLLTFVVILLVWVIDQKQFSKSMEAGIWRSFYEPKETARYPNYYLAKIRKKEKNNRKVKGSFMNSATRQQPGWVVKCVE